MLLALIVFIGTFMVYSSSDDAGQSRIRQKEQTARALALAKETLLSHAIIDAVSNASQSSPRPGELPCPDKDNDGAADGGNACTLVGWLPWKTLELEDLRDTADEHLWYAVSEDFQDDGNSEPVINSAATFSDLLHILDASGVETGTAAAVIIAPGSALAGQTRSAGDNVAADVIQQYLEGTNSDSDDTFTSETASGLNDQIIIITAEELVERATDLAMREAASVMKQYYNENHFYPYAEFDKWASCDANSASLQRTIGFLPVKSYQDSSTWPPLSEEPNSYPGPCPYSYSLSKEELGEYGLRDWFINQGWHKSIFGVIAPACTFDGCAKTGGVCTGCNSTGAFLSLSGAGGIQAMVVNVGVELANTVCAPGVSHTQARVIYPDSGYDNLCDYLESSDNTDNNEIFVQQTLSATANDDFLIVDP